MSDASAEKKSAPKPLSKRQGLKDDATVYFWPSRDALPAKIQAYASDHAAADSLSTAGFVAANVPDRASAVDFFDNQLGEVADVPSIWVIYPKGNRADINRDSLWELLLDYQWRPVSNIAVDDTHSSIRIRPLNPGESGTHK